MDGDELELLLLDPAQLILVRGGGRWGEPSPHHGDGVLQIKGFFLGIFALENSPACSSLF